jgi:hypothetical protein
MARHRTKRVKRRQGNRRGRGRRPRRQPWQPRPDSRKTWADCQRHFLTAGFWKAAHGAARGFRAHRWRLQAVVMVAMLQVSLTARTVQERFEQARVLWTRLRPGRRRVGQTVKGFLNALGRLPRRVFQAVAPVLQQRVATVLKRVWTEEGWVPMGVDGTHVELPRTAELERRFGRPGTRDSAPQLWVTAVVHLPTGVPWSWQVGRSKSSERRHLSCLIASLPPRTLLVADAGFVGYDLWQELDAAGVAFLIRVHSHVHLYTERAIPADFRQGRVYFWPQKPRRRPMPLRLIRLPAREAGGTDVWLVTNVLDPQRLSWQTASRLFTMRWQQEVFYRSYKCTLSQAKLASRSARQVIREIQTALLATQVIMAQAAWAMARQSPSRRAAVAEVMRQIRREHRDLLAGHLRTGYLERLSQAVREDRPHRTSSKQHRTWPRKKPHRPPGPPKVITLTPRARQKLENDLRAA